MVNMGAVGGGDRRGKEGEGVEAAIPHEPGNIVDDSLPDCGPKKHALMPFVYSAMAGATGTAVSHPFDTWAVFRATNRPLPTPLAFYRGVTVSCTQNALVYGVLLGTYEKLISEHGFSWYTASLVSTIPEAAVRGPLEAWKNMQQTLYRPVGEELVRMLGKATFGTWIRECPGNLIYFGAFDYLRNSTDCSTIVAAALTGALFGAVVYPLEAIRTQVATGKPIRFTYRGAMPYIGRSVTMITCTFTAFKFYTGRDLGADR